MEIDKKSNIVNLKKKKVSVQLAKKNPENFLLHFAQKNVQN